MSAVTDPSLRASAHGYWLVQDDNGHGAIHLTMKGRVSAVTDPSLPASAHGSGLRCATAKATAARGQDDNGLVALLSTMKCRMSAVTDPSLRTGAHGYSLRCATAKATAARGQDDNGLRLFSLVLYLISREIASSQLTHKAKYCSSQ